MVATPLLRKGPAQGNRKPVGKVPCGFATKSADLDPARPERLGRESGLAATWNGKLGAEWLGRVDGGKATMGRILEFHNAGIYAEIANLKGLS